MATNEAKTSLDLDALFTQLAEPFDPSEIKWRVTHTTRDGSRGAVIAYADPRAYTDRLNQLFTPSGWTRNYDVTAVSDLSRQKRDKMIQTGKVLVTCTLTIARLGTHTGSGEQWADEQNAMTAAEAQAFKRASSCFGLGRYLYNLPETWVSTRWAGQADQASGTSRLGASEGEFGDRKDQPGLWSTASGSATRPHRPEDHGED